MQLKAMTYAVIMAGGVGSRFWPASTRKHPKQFLNLFGERSLLQQTADRIAPIIPQENIYVVTNQDYVEKVQAQLPDVPPDQIIGEPVAKNTAPCVAAAAMLIDRKDEGATMVVLPADHFITDAERFRSILTSSIAKAQQGSDLVTIGIKPDRPETGYGYIQFHPDKVQQLEGNPVHPVKTFTEKPGKEVAQKFLESGDFLWNSGMFIWKSSTVLAEIKEHLPEMHAQAEVLREDPSTSNINDFYHNCTSISIDYGIMEHAESVYVVPGQFGWNDVGSWKAVYELADKDGDQNAHRAEHSLFVESEGSMVHTASGKMVAVVGLDDVALVETDDAILVVNLNRAQDVKQVVNKLKDDDETDRFV